MRKLNNDGRGGGAAKDEDRGVGVVATVGMMRYLLVVIAASDEDKGMEWCNKDGTYCTRPHALYSIYAL